MGQKTKLSGENVIFGLIKNYMDQTDTFVFRNIFAIIFIFRSFWKVFKVKKNLEKFPTVQDYSKIHENFPLCNEAIDVTCETFLQLFLFFGLFGKFFNLKNHEKYPTVQNYSKIHDNFPLCNDVIDVTCEVYIFRST